MRARTGNAHREAVVARWEVPPIGGLLMKTFYTALFALTTLVSIAGSVSAADQVVRNAKQFFEQRERESGGGD